MSGRTAVTWLFVPGSRADRFARAAGSGADEVIVDLEDAVAPDAKEAARDQAASWLGGHGSGWVRINGAGTPWHESDLAAIGACVGLRGVVIPKAEDPASLGAVREALPASVPLLALVESALGVHLAPEIACSGVVDRLAFGTVDFALDIGAEESDEALLFARSALVVASRVGSLPPPVDGVTVSTTVESEARRAAVRAQGLGFGGKLCIHPRQVRPVAEGFQPTSAQVAWASRVLQATNAEETGAVDRGVICVDGRMVDRPVIARALAVLGRARSGYAE